MNVIIIGVDSAKIAHNREPGEYLVGLTKINFVDSYVEMTEYLLLSLITKPLFRSFVRITAGTMFRSNEPLASPGNNAEYRRTRCQVHDAINSPGRELPTASITRVTTHVPPPRCDSS